MNCKNSASVSRSSKEHWFKPTRHKIGWRLMKLGHWAERMAVFVAPWLDKERPR